MTGVTDLERSEQTLKDEVQDLLQRIRLSEEESQHVKEKVCTHVLIRLVALHDLSYPKCHWMQKNERDNLSLFVGTRFT